MNPRPNKVFSLPDGVEQPWSYVIGGLVLNCGAIEMSLIRLAEVISQSDEKRNESIRKLFSGRVSLVEELLNLSTISQSLKESLRQTLREVRGLSKLRNTVVHNPYIRGKDAQGNEIEGIMDARKVEGDGPYSVELVFYDEIKEGALTAGDLGRRLQSHILEIMSERQN